MNNRKLVMINGLSFDKKADMQLLQKYAKEGWILEGVVGGIFYKLKKDKPKDIVYIIDYKSEVDEEYLDKFKSSGWNLVVSYKKSINIFSAPLGTKQIYTDNIIEAEKYLVAKKSIRKSVLYSFGAAVVLLTLLLISSIYISSLFLVLEGLLIIDLLVLFINLITYLSFKNTIRNLKKGIKIKKNRSSYKLYLVEAILFTAIGLSGLNSGKIYSIFFVILGIVNFICSYSYKKKY